MIGRKLSHYDVTSALGAGGMGEVYRATDTKLGRDVAIKVLPAEVARDPERLARFRREAQLLAALNHPHIAAIHGLEEADETPFLALELVEGDDLSERLKRGPLPIDEALEVAGQIAEALEAAHEKGIVHRDLKPANVKITPEGQVKVLDFGLAKAWAGEAGTGTSSVDLSQSPTLAHTGTAAGIILGTAAYMSPEQASGKPVDKRADIWSFGAVLFELLTGERTFVGENASEILASVIKEEPDWEKLPHGTPRSVTRLLRRCLQKKTRGRLRDIGDAHLDLEEGRRELASGPAETGAGTAAPGREHLAWGAAAALGIAAVGLASWALLRGPAARGPLQLSVPLAPAQLDGAFALSPDGSRVVFPGQNEEGERLLYVRALDEPAARALPGTEDALDPFFSPDGEWIAFFGGVASLKKVPVNGGPVLTVAEGNFRSSVGTWTDDDWIVMTQPVGDLPGELLRVRAEGGSLEPLKTSDEAARQAVETVSAIPGSPAVLLTLGARERGSTDDDAVAIQSLETGERHVLAPGGSRPRALEGGHVVYRHSGRLMAAPLDATGTALSGTPVTLEDVTGPHEVGWFDLSRHGVLTFFPRRDDGQHARMARTDRDGGTTPLVADLAGGDPRLSPDSTRLALNRNRDVWVTDLDRGTLTRISSAEGEDETAVWSPDGRWIAWAGSRPGQPRTLFRRRSDGSGPEEAVWSDPRHFHLASWSSAGIVVTVADPETDWDVLLLDPDDATDGRPLLNQVFAESSARVSPDGRLLAFVSDETGRNEVYVQAFPEPAGKVQVSLDGGQQPVWRPGTREIVFRGSGQIMTVTLGSGAAPAVAAPEPLFEDRLPGLDEGDHTYYAVDREGRLIGLQVPERPPIRDIRIVLDWVEEAGLRP